jgi:hypothetical protein
MLIANEGRRIVVGNEACATGLRPLSFNQWIGLFAVITQGLPLLGMLAFFPDTLTDPLFVAGTLIVAGGISIVALAARYLMSSICGTEDVIAAIFDRDTAAIDIVFNGLFGLTHQAVPFDDVNAIRLGRGEWEGEKVRETTVLKLFSGRSISLPEALSTKDLHLLKALTGLRR